MKSPKFFRDPIHDIIKFSNKDSFLLDIIDSSPFQRLRRIKQLGFVDYVYPGAQHTRFAHSLGSYHLANRVVEQLNSVKPKPIDIDTRKLILSAALLHDIGHGPFSHIFESVLKELECKPHDHEKWSWKIIENSELRKILEEKGKIKINRLKELFDKTFTPKLAFSIISSQFDVDRLDYLLRDSIMTGCKYSRIDLEWIIRNLVATPPIDTNLKNIDIAIDGRRGISCIDQYLLGRFHNYKHIIYHKTVRSAEMMFKRILTLGLTDDSEKGTLMNDALIKIAGKKDLDINDYLSLDDNIIMAQVERWSKNASNEVLKDLSERLLNRKLFKMIKIDIESRQEARRFNKIEKLLKRKKKDPDSYMLEDTSEIIAYKDIIYSNSIIEEGSEIKWVDTNGKVELLSRNENSLLGRKPIEFKEKRYYIPLELKAEIERILEGR